MTEGEKAADGAARLFPEAVTTTPPHGAEAPKYADWTVLKGRVVVIWPDHDQVGVDFAVTVAKLATEAGASEVRIVSVPADFPEKWDPADASPDGWSPEQLRGLFDDAVLWVDASAENDADSPDKQWATFVEDHTSFHAARQKTFHRCWRKHRQLAKNFSLQTIDELTPTEWAAATQGV